jgi:hypothetical protein
MSTEKVAKAAMIKFGVDFNRYSHVAFSTLPHRLQGLGIGTQLGWPSERAFVAAVRSSRPLLRGIDELQPAVGAQRPGGGPSAGPNVEYPWIERPDNVTPRWRIPAHFDFDVSNMLRGPQGRTALVLVQQLLDRLPEIA